MGKQVIIIIMYIYHALINALSAHMTHINLNMIFYTHVGHSPTKTVHIKYYLTKYIYMKKRTANTHTHARTHEKRKVFSLALKDDRVEQCLRSCGSELQM